MNHDFIKLTTKQGLQTIVYFKCQLCGKVMFERDDYFNMICLKALASQEKLRQELEVS